MPTAYTAEEAPSPGEGAWKDHITEAEWSLLPEGQKTITQLRKLYDLAHLPNGKQQRDPPRVYLDVQGLRLE